MRKLPAGIGITLLVLQLLFIALARVVPARYFCWAPFDMQTDYTLEVKLGGRHLTPQEIRQRYRRPAKGTDNRSVQNLIDIIELSEARYPIHQQATVVMRYRINGKQEQEWIYPLSY